MLSVVWEFLCSGIYVNQDVVNIVENNLADNKVIKCKVLKWICEDPLFSIQFWCVEMFKISSLVKNYWEIFVLLKESTILTSIVTISCINLKNQS